MQLLGALASLKVTLAALALLVAAVCLIYVAEAATSATLSAPLGLLSLNLLAAIVTNRVFRRQTALLIFHLALLALVGLLAAGRLTYLTGHMELSDGEEFTGTLLQTEAGPYHPMEALRALRFTNLGFHIDYAPGPLRQGIRNQIEVAGAGNIPFRQEITDQKPLLLAGYRFYPTGNKGFAPAFAWHPAAGGAARTGTVHLPSYPLHEHGQAREWTPPGTQLRLWTMLEFKEIILAPDRPSVFRPPREHTLVLRLGDRRWELVPGASIELPEGRIEYLGLRSWMGYTVFYDWTIPWLLAACLAAIGALGAHFWNKFAAKPWNG